MSLHANALLLVRPDVFECGPRCRCSGLCGNRVTQLHNSHNPWLSLRLFFNERKGWGVECMQAAKAGEFVDEYRVSQRTATRVCSSLYLRLRASGSFHICVRCSHERALEKGCRKTDEDIAAEDDDDDSGYLFALTPSAIHASAVTDLQRAMKKAGHTSVTAALNKWPSVSVDARECGSLARCQRHSNAAHTADWLRHEATGWALKRVTLLAHPNIVFADC